MTHTKQKIVIAGVGFIGRAWAISFARAGHDVVLWARRPEAAEAAREPIADILPSLEKQELLMGSSADATLARIAAAPTLSAALDGADYVQENIAEDAGAKAAFFCELDALAPRNAILASSSSAILPSDFTKDVPGRRRCLVVHPINPPFLIPAVEVVPAPWTDDAVTARARDMMSQIGQAPIVMQKEIPGFVMNRIQGAVLQEIFRLVTDGYADIEDIDSGLRDGLALRWAVMGPFETIDLNAPDGVRQYAERYEALYSALHETQINRASWTGPILDRIEERRRALLPAGDLEDRRLWRDMMLARLVAAKTEALADLQ
ncbi:3-hydroxyacyl-CoA dehydrogenase [Thalassococcus sp. S3]|uniref:3-hydroxyacyl-CoA dehydrogenase n=1 Tax=Thalassococcus sp. S3 TaxID=2017482 RepID=UPI0010243EDC|nr:3-hydroxyacyl-CoA dehydrogenase [Thalassococcus sp. S3]QBF30809.1 3-hydroxyacyl-CoA dehydrogenase [Thalassococcus sp. S3]